MASISIGLERLAEFAMEGLEAGVRHERVAEEPEADHRKPPPRKAPAGAGDLVRRNAHGRRRRFAERAAIGREGWESTGATTAGSVIIARAKLPVKHMPTAPTPLPPHSAWAWAARARSQSTIGLDRSLAQTWNSRLMQMACEHHAKGVPARHLAPRLAEEAGAEDGHAGGRHPVGEADDQGMQPGHLVDHDHRRTRPASPNRPRPASGRIGEVEACVVLQGVDIGHQQSLSRERSRTHAPPRRASAAP